MKARAWAPGKVIILGEHFVVHGSYAIAAAIDRGITATAEPSDKVEILSRRGNTRPIKLAVEELLKLIGEKGVRVRLRTDLPVGAGLGSSSASAVASLKAVAKLYGYDDEEEIWRLAMKSERMIHKNPSGIDVTVSLHGGVLLYRIGERPKKLTLKRPLELVVIYSKVGKRTAEMIKRFSSMKGKAPSYFKALVDSCSSLILSAVKLVEEADYRNLATYMNVFHAILSRMGVSSRVLDRVVELALEKGALGAKLTGGGGGGSVIAVSDDPDGLVRRLEPLGYSPFKVVLPVGGSRAW